MDPIIAQNIVRLHRNGRGINGVSLSVKAGQCFGVLGSNGSGKTTLTRLVAGIDRIESGRLSVLGKPAFPRPANLRRLCGVALDTPAHWETLSGRQNLLFFARQFGLSGSDLNHRVNELLGHAELAAQANEPVAVYSFGMRRKLSIIESLVHDPDLLILDEPSAGVDLMFLDRLVQWINRRCEQGKTTWITDNDADWLARMATDVILLSDGRIEAEGTVSKLLASVSARSRVEILLEQSTFNARPTISGIVTFQCEDNHICADIDGSPDLPVKLLQWITEYGGRIRSMKIRSITLYEALMRNARRKDTLQ
jgi:ABC-type multidrug transport system ATPase subunit